jgi:hypothetical protein
MLAYLAKGTRVAGHEIVLILASHDAGHTTRATGGIEEKGIFSHEYSL